MLDYLKTMIRPFRWVHFPKFIFFLGLLTESLMFPCMQVSVGLMQKYLVNAVEYKNMNYMTYVYVLAAAILFMVIVFNPLGEYLKERAMWTFTKNLRELTIERLISYRFSFFETYQTGDLVLRLREDLDAIPNIYTNSIFRLLLGLFYGGGSVIVMLTFSWQLSLVVIALCLSESFAMAKMSEKITENSDILQKIMSKQNQMFFDIVKSLSFIKMASISRLIGERYNKYNEETAAKNTEINKVNVLLNVFNDLFVAVNLLLVFSLGIVMYLADMIDLGSVMSFLYLQDGISYMIGNLRDFFSGISSQIVNYNRVSELLNQEVEEMDAESDMGKEPMELRCDDIIIKDLSFRYQTADKCTLNEVNLTIPKGKVTVIYGTSGGGKSTLVKLLLALYPPDSGSICIGETDYRQIGNTSIRDYYAYVEQSTYLFYDTVEANIRCNNEKASFEEVMEAAKLAMAHDFIMQKPDGYQTMIHEHGSNFSGGERQRIAIARAILKNAYAVIFDEATSAVDSKNESYIYDQLRKMASRGKAVLIIAHRENARQLADNEIRIEDGLIAGR